MKPEIITGQIETSAVAGAVTVLDRAAVDRALRTVIEYADYDLHKALEGDETGEDTYAEHVARFIASYGAQGAQGECGHDWFEMTEAEGSGLYLLCRKCGDDKPMED